MSVVAVRLLRTAPWGANARMLLGAGLAIMDKASKVRSCSARTQPQPPTPAPNPNPLTLS